MILVLTFLHASVFLLYSLSFGRSSLVLIHNQPLPGLFEPIAVYMGIAFLLWGIGLFNQKVLKALKFLASEEAAAVGINLMFCNNQVYGMNSVPKECYNNLLAQMLTEEFKKRNT